MQNKESLRFQRAENALNNGCSIGVESETGMVFQLANGTIESCDPVAERLLGYSAKQLVGITSFEAAWQMIYPDSSPVAPEDYPAITTLRSGKPCRHVVIGFHRPSGDLVWLQLNSTPLFQADTTTPYGVATTLSEVTSSQKKAPQLETNLQPLAILEQMTDAFIALDREWRVIYVNQEVTRINNTPVTEMVGKTYWELWSWSIGTSVEQNYRRAMAEQQPVHFEVLYEPLMMWLEIHAYPSEVGLGIFFRNITERKRIEVTLRASEQRFHDLADNAPIMIWVTDGTGYCTYLSRSWYDFSGQTEVTGLGFGWLDVVHPDDRESSKTIFLAAKDRQEAFRLEYRLRRKDGEYRTCIDTAKPWFGADGEFKGYIGSVIDIDERKQIETALSRSEERYRTLFESIDEGFCVIEMLFDKEDTPLDYRFLEINPIFEQQTGLRQAVGKTARQLVPELEDHWLKTYGQVALTGKSIRFVDGSEAMDRWFDVYACRTGQPEDRKVALVFKDISDHKRAEKISRRTAEFNAFRISLSDALRPLADPVKIQATASRVLGEYLGANRVAYFEVRGADYIVERDYVEGAEALVGKYPIDSFGPKLLAAYRRGHTVYVSDVETDPNLSLEQRSAYAAIQIGSYIGIPLVKGSEFVAGLAVHTSESRAWTPDEISLAEEVAERTWAAVERAHAEAALRDSENRFRMAIESGQLGTWDWNLSTNQLSWDERCKTMFSLPPEAQSSIEVFFAGLHPDDQDRVEQIIQWALNPASNGKFEVEYRTIGIQDGVERWVAAKGQVYFDATDNPQRFIGTILNITQQKRIEAEREQLLIREQAAREIADRANRIKDEFLAVLSHELRTPLNPILGWSRLLQQGKLDAAKTTTALATIERNARLQVQLIDDLLDISRILSGKMSLAVMPVDLSSVISAALETVRLAAETKSIQIQTIVSPAVGIVNGDAGRLQQVVWNLLSNAIKFTPQGGQVSVALVSNDDHAQIQVTDTGKGIHSDFLPHVFEHFRQEDGATTRKFGGLGLGLAIVRQIIEIHGGTVAVDSLGVGQGAIFTVQIPFSRQSIDLSIPEPSSVATNDLSGIQILVVDDELDSRDFITLVLEQANAKVTTAASGIEALQIFSQSIPDLIVSDIGMPEVDGYMLLRQIRSLPLEQGGQIPAIALTAYAGELDRQQAITAGFQQHIPKPIDPEAVVTIIAKLIEK